MSEVTGAPSERIGVVVIGRNEGERLKACLRSLAGLKPVVYVDSGSTDGSVDFARGTGAFVVELAVPPHFTAARARNAGLEALVEADPAINLVQTIDGDCTLDPRWLETAAGAMRDDPDLGAVLGRLREHYPDRSIYNALCDHEWDGVAGEAPGFGGIALLRVAAVEQAGGYRPDMIAGEDTEMAMRMRKKGWRLLRLPADMARHDANILRFGQWWRRARRGGHGFAEMAHLHPDARWPNWTRTCRSIIVWGAIGPSLAVSTLLLGIFASLVWLLGTALLVGAYTGQVLRVARAKRRLGLPPRLARAFAGLLVLGKLPEFLGLLQFHRNRLGNRRSTLIEYKGMS